MLFWLDFNALIICCKDKGNNISAPKDLVSFFVTLTKHFLFPLIRMTFRKIRRCNPYALKH